MGKKGIPQGQYKSTRVATDHEAEMPKSDQLNVWDSEFGWVLKDGKPTKTTKAYWKKKRRELKQ